MINYRNILVMEFDGISQRTISSSTGHSRNTVAEVVQRAEKLKDLPVETIHYDLSNAEKVCSACNHALHEMRQQTRQELKIVPAQIKVVEHVQHIYSCRHCEKHAKPNPVIPKGLASPSAIAFIREAIFKKRY